MIKAGSLTYAIFLAIVTAILCSMMILLAFHNRSYFIRMDVHDVLKDNAYSGVALGMTWQEQNDVDKWIDIYGERKDSVHLKRRQWGIYHLVSSSAIANKQVYRKTALVGAGTSIIEQTALWLTDHNRPLKLAGKALLKGECYLPQKGIDRAYVEGQKYERDRMVYGKIRHSERNLLEPPEGLRSYWAGYFTRAYAKDDSIVGFENLQRKFTQPFHQKTVVVYSPGPINLRQFSLEGNVIVVSDRSIKVDTSTRLANVVLLAPVIKIGSKATIIAQLIARDTLVLERQALMHYPSSIIMTGTRNTDPCLVFEEGARAYGTVACFKRSDLRSNNVAVDVGVDAEVRGLLYCEGNLQVSGTVHGAVIANNFLLKTPSGIYENHLLNGTIDRGGMPAEFATLSFKDHETYSTIASWLSY